MRRMLLGLLFLTLSIIVGCSSNKNNDISININDTSKFIAVDSEKSLRITVYVREWADGQERDKEQPKGAYVENIPVEITTSMGSFTDSNKAAQKGKTNSDGEMTVGLKGGEIPGMATVTAKLLDGSGHAATLRVPIVRLSILPLDAVITQNKYISFECRVDGPDDPDMLYYIWSHEKIRGCLQPQGSDEVYVDRTSDSNIIRSPYLEWHRYDGKEAEGYLKAEVFMIDDEGKAMSLGAAQAKLKLQEYKVGCALVGRVERGDTWHDVKYGFLIPKVKGATGYGVIGTGFNDPQYYGDRYSAGIFLGTTRYPYEEEGGGYFVPLTSGTGSGSASDKSDTELLEDFKKRFEGGVFYAWPNFGPSSTYEPD